MKTKFTFNAILITICLLASVSLSFAGAIQLPQTGQTTCYDELGNPLGCLNTGQDGDWLAGMPWPDPRFVSGTGTEADCIIDSQTGLMWPKNGDLAGGTRKWQEALDYANALGYCGHSDWRLPNIIELDSLINLDVPLTYDWLMMPAQGFTSVRGNYWSSTTSSVRGYAKTFGMGTGNIGALNKLSTSYVWPVRTEKTGIIPLSKTGQDTCYNTSGAVIACSGTGQDGSIRAGVLWPDPRFAAGTGTEAGCMTDRLTGLMWPKNGDLTNSLSTWQEALDHANSLNYCGHSDWRLPNRKELYSLVNAQEPDMAVWLNSQGFNNVVSGYYWSSSTYIYSLDDAWGISLWQGDVQPRIKHGASGSIWPVRGGQADKLPPLAPDSLRATANTASKVTLTWDDNSSYEGSIRVFRREGAGSLSLLKSLPPNTQAYTDLTALDNNAVTSYSYHVKACNPVGCSTLTPMAIVPFSPANLVASKVTGGVKLTWKDNSSNEKGFQIYRKNGSCSSADPMKLVKTTIQNVVTFTNTGLAAGQYSYRIRSFTQNGTAPFSQGFSVLSDCVTVTVP